MEITIKELGQDFWGRNVYKNVDNGNIYKLVKHSLAGYPRPWYFTASSFDGEPDCPLRKDIKITKVTKEEFKMTINEIGKWYEGISADLLGNDSDTDTLEEFASLYEKELKKLLPDIEIEVNLLNTLNGHTLNIYNKDGEQIFDFDSMKYIEYQNIKEKAWDRALERLYQEA